MALYYHFTPQEIISQGRTTAENLKTIRNFVESLNQKPVPRHTQDETLILFLLSCDNDLELTKKTILSYYNSKRNCPEIFDGRNMNSSDIQNALNTM